ncbi:hypothetical protein BD626DRAFT_459015 [Schizophyllum amplum]|uniref:Phosducin thioredoxin-like domain-containing protein n=1 Tax=Schizophyllum amplum TaxID=97359 RepID=A0A550CB66_9AGAR|nr:hypothetical protein BD626DRAFT_459015 [Auriculariopsis ampla]
MDLEELVLSGKLFNPSSPSTSPPRTPSPDAGWHDDELEQDDDEQPYTSSLHPTASSNATAADPGVGVGVPGRTGVKGVLRDRAEFRERAQAEAQAKAAQRQVPGIGGQTYLEEQRTKAAAGERADPLVTDARGQPQRMDKWGAPRGRFGHLREVGMRGFVDAVEKEAGVWVAVHLYDSSLDRCYILDDTLAKLARAHPDTKFLRARAAALGFASTSAPPRGPARTMTVSRKTIPEEEDSDDEKANSGGYLGRTDDDSPTEEDDEYDSDAVDTDVLPTLLVYRDGELVHNWVRVDLDAGKERGGVEDLLARHTIITGGGATLRDGTTALDYRGDEADLVLSDEE